MSKIPPAMWEDPDAFEPEEVREATEETEPDDGVFKRVAKDDGEAVEEPAEG
jgi:hypothetical protein